jgi:hypothetical protein
MTKPPNPFEPQGPPPPWIGDFKRKLRAALASADPNSKPFDPPAGTSLSELAGYTVAVFLKKPNPTGPTGGG